MFNKYYYIIDPYTLKQYYLFNKNGIKILNRYILYGGQKKKYFKKQHNLNTQKQKYCRCILHVAKNNSKKCNENRDWNSPKCYNPYTVCAASVKTTTGGKSCMYDFSNKDIPENEIQAYIQLNKHKFGNCIKKNTRQNLVKCY